VEHEDVGAGKYITFKRQDFLEWFRPGMTVATPPEEVPDAVVIRLQDSFAPVALCAYKNAVRASIEDENVGIDRITRRRLVELYEYFHERSEKSWMNPRRLPD